MLIFKALISEKSDFNKGFSSSYSDRDEFSVNTPVVVVRKITKRMTILIRWWGLVCVFLFIFSSQSFPQRIEKPQYFESFFDPQIADKLLKQSINYSTSGNVYNFMNLRAFLGANNSIISVNLSKDVINYQKQIVDNLIQSARISKTIPNNKSPFKDSYKGWISNVKDRSFHEESSLYESYSFFYVVEFLYLLKKNKWVNLSEENALWWNETLYFVESEIWSKWYIRPNKNRSEAKRYHVFLKMRTHMGSHWAGIAIYLKEICSSTSIKNQCIKVINDYDLLLKRNFKRNPKYAEAYIWNSTYDNVKGTDADAIRPSIIQDVSHGNHVVSYIVAAYEMGSEQWEIHDIQLLCNTVKHVIYNERTNTFSDLVDGSRDKLRPGRGNFVADGWVKLANYDNEVKEIFKKFESDGRMLVKYKQELQFKASLHRHNLSLR